MHFVEKYIEDISDLRRVELVLLSGLGFKNSQRPYPPNDTGRVNDGTTDFFNAIRRMPRLQELHLYGVVFPPYINVLTPTADDTIELPLLRVLILRGTALEAANVIRPSSTFTSLQR